MAIWAEQRPTRKARSADALRKAADDPLIICTVARLFWAERKIEKARQWFERAIKLNPDLGDIWAWWWKFEKEHGMAVSISPSRLKRSADINVSGTPSRGYEEVLSG